MIMEDEKEKADEEILDIANKINISAERLGVLVDDLLNVSRIEQNRIKMEPEQLDPQPLVKEVIEEHELQAREKNLKINYQKPQENILIEIDKDRFRQIMINLVSNAVKYTQEGEIDVKMEVDKTGRQLMIKVKDSGIGMSAKDREKLFSKFYRVQNKHTRDVSGTGLGLWITKRLVEIMKGSISVDSIEGVGSQFTITFSIYKKDKK